MRASCISKTYGEGLIKLIGKRYGLLTIVQDVGVKKKNRLVKCRCDCGRTKTIQLRSLKSQNTRSCGCLRDGKIGALNRTHGMKGTHKQHPLYLVWRGIKTRCFNPRCKAFKTYGARGITICAEWKDDPVAFAAWCLEHGWKPGLTIERIDNDGDYEPSNCEFISKSENTIRRLRREQRDREHFYILAALSMAA